MAGKNKEKEKNAPVEEAPAPEEEQKKKTKNKLEETHDDLIKFLNEQYDLFVRAGLNHDEDVVVNEQRRELIRAIRNIIG